MLKNYIGEQDIASLKKGRKIAISKIYSYLSLSTETRLCFDKLNTAYQLIKSSLDVLDKEITHTSQHGMNPSQSKIVALVKIVRSVNELLSEMVLIYLSSERHLTLNHLFRQLTEYFIVFCILSEQPYEISTLYLNHLNVLAYKTTRSNRSVVDKNLQYVYDESIKIFSKHHNISDYEIAQKEYEKPYGWAYKIIEDSNGDYYNYLSSYKVRNHVFSKYYDKKYIAKLNDLIKTADLAVHPTPTYIYNIQEMNNSKSTYLQFIYNTSMDFYFNTLFNFANSLEKSSLLGEVINAVLSIIKSISYKDISETPNEDIDIKDIKKHNKYTIKFIDPNNEAKRILENFIENNSDILPYHITLHYSYFNRDSFEKHISRNLDIVSTILSRHSSEICDFYPQVLPSTPKLENNCAVFKTISSLLDDMVISYSFRKKHLFQKQFRILVEYMAILNKLNKSNMVTNDAFKWLSYVLLETSIFSADFDYSYSNKIIDNISKVLMLPEEYKPRIKSFMGWCIETKNNKIRFCSLQRITTDFVMLVDKNNSGLQQVLDECTAVMHAGLYADEIQNNMNSYQPIISSYFAYILLMSLEHLNDMLRLSKSYNNQKLFNSNMQIADELGRMFIRLKSKIRRTKI